MEDILIKIGIGVSIAVVSSVITSLITFHLTTLRFKNEKVWELKAKAYREIIETLSDSVRSLNAVVKHESGEARLDNEYMNEQVAINNECQKKIRRAVDIGSFLLSEDAENRLIKYEKNCAEASKGGSNLDFLQSVSDEGQKCMKDLKVLAKSDLKK